MCDWPTLDCVSVSAFSMSTISPVAGGMTSASSSSCLSSLGDAIRYALADDGGCRRRTAVGRGSFLELRQRYSLLNIADRLYELAKRRLDVGGEA